MMGLINAQSFDEISLDDKKSSKGKSNGVYVAIAVVFVLILFSSSLSQQDIENDVTEDFVSETITSTSEVMSTVNQEDHGYDQDDEEPVEYDEYQLVEMDWKDYSDDLEGWADYAVDWFDFTLNQSNQHMPRDRIFKMVAVYTFVNYYLTYQADPVGSYTQSPYESLTLRTGDCEDYAVLMATLCEYHGLDTSIELAYASENSEYGSEPKNKNHAMCFIYFNVDLDDLQNELSQLSNFYGVSQLKFWRHEEPCPIIMRSAEGFLINDNKYAKGIWVSLESWDELKTYHRIDYDNNFLYDFQEFRDLMNRPYPYPGVTFTYDMTPQEQGYLLSMDFQINNLGALIAKDVVIWAGLDAGNGKVYDQDKSNFFDLSSDQHYLENLQLDVRKGVKTKILIRVDGSNFERIHQESEWFETGAVVAMGYTSEVQGDTVTLHVTIRNDGEISAKNIIVYANFDYGNGMVYKQPANMKPKSQPLNIAPYETQIVDLQLKIPKNVYTRVLLYAYGDNLELTRIESQWFNT